MSGKNYKTANIFATTHVIIYIFNHLKHQFANLEKSLKVKLSFFANDSLMPEEFKLYFDNSSKIALSSKVLDISQVKIVKENLIESKSEYFKIFNHILRSIRKLFYIT